MRRIAFTVALVLLGPLPVCASNADEPPSGLSTEAYDAVRSHIERDRYAVRPTADEGLSGNSLEGVNSAQAYTTRFTPQGIVLRPRGTDVALGFTLSGWGYGTVLLPVDAASPQANGQRVEYVRGTLIEWYVNRRSGLEQGFTLNAPPQAVRGDGRLRLELKLSGPLVAEASGGAIVFRDTNGRTRLRYGGLKAWDATGREFVADMTVADNRLTLEVDEAEAVYPVTVDPTIVNETAKLLPSDGHDEDFFGGSVAMSGNTAVVSASGDDDNGSDSGSAYVFDLSGATGIINETAKLQPSDGDGDDWFGSSVAVSGNTAVVGADWDSDNGLYSGSAYVFDLNGATGTINETAKLLPSDGAEHGEFGVSVAVSGNTAVVGAHGDDDNGWGSGSAYVFDLNGATGTINETAKLQPSDGATSERFGVSVAMSGNTAVVGAYGDYDNGVYWGSAYVFDLSGATGTINETAKLQPSDSAGDDWFGSSVAVSGNTAVVGAHGDDDNGLYSGSAYVFDLNGATGTINETAKLQPSDGAENDVFGRSVAVSGNMAVVSASWDDDNGPFSGSTYVFDLNGATGTTNETAKPLPSDGAEQGGFGRSVAVSGNTAVVGAIEDYPNSRWWGSAYVFDLCFDHDSDGVSICDSDCADTNPDVYPGAPQICDGVNNDCEDSAWPAVPSNEIDDDNDGYAECEGDCRDDLATVNPDGVEVCNDLDDDCNDLTDDDDLGEDSDADGVRNLCDNCRELFNPGQGDTDADSFGNACDNCIFVPNDQTDLDSDDRGDICDNCPSEFNPFQDDFDEDNVGDVCDNCFDTPNPAQPDVDDDFEGDHCDLDDDLIYVSFKIKNKLLWQEEVGYLTWNAYRGDLADVLSTGTYTQLPGSNDLAGQQCGALNPFWQGVGVPDPGTTAFFLVTGIDNQGESSLGTNSTGTERSNDNPCP